MKLDKVGVVVTPKKYENWNVELLGDTNDTGGIYAFLLPPNNLDKTIFWDTTIEGIEKQLVKHRIVIIWGDDHTLEAFLSKQNLSKKLANKIIKNLYEQTENEMVFNRTQLKFLFGVSTIILSYYVVDSRYSNVNISFGQMENLLLDYLKN